MDLTTQAKPEDSNGLMKIISSIGKIKQQTGWDHLI